MKFFFLTFLIAGVGMVLEERIKDVLNELKEIKEILKGE